MHFENITLDTVWRRDWEGKQLVGSYLAQVRNYVCGALSTYSKSLNKFYSTLFYYNVDEMP